MGKLAGRKRNSFDARHLTSRQSQMRTTLICRGSTLRLGERWDTFCAASTEINAPKVGQFDGIQCRSTRTVPSPAGRPVHRRKDPPGPAPQAVHVICGSAASPRCRASHAGQPRSVEPIPRRPGGQPRGQGNTQARTPKNSQTQ